MIQSDVRISNSNLMATTTPSSLKDTTEESFLQGQMQLLYEILSTYHLGITVNFQLCKFLFRALKF